VGLTETLRLLVEADTRGAVRDVERLGATSARELGKSQDSLDKWGQGLSKAGAGMFALGGAALFGLGSLAKASEEANLAQVQLQNVLGNMPKLAGENAKQFNDLADSIQSKTAADGDAIVSGEAMLATFNLTAGQIKEITPLVVDYARRFGVDIPTAAATVGKALDGNVTALKKNGISIDEAAFATDHYRAVQAALSNQVGGFAEQEGKTFSGSLARMKNELGDLAEGVGGGAVDAFTKMFGAVGEVVGVLEKVSPGAQHAAGEFATFAAAGLTAAGGLSFLIGQGILARQRFGELASGVSALTTKLGGIGAVAGLAAGAAGIGALVFAANQVNEAANRVNFDKLAAALTSTSSASRDALKEFVTMSVAFDRLDENFGKLLDTSVPAAEQFIRVAESMGLQKEAVDGLKKALEEKKAADVGGTAAQSDYSNQVQTGADAMSDQADATNEAKTALQEYNDALHASFDPLFAAIDSGNRLRDAQLEVAQATTDLDTAIREHGADSAEAAEAQRKLSDAQLDGVQAAVDQESALAELKDQIDQGTLSVDSAKSRLALWVAQGKITQEQANVAAAAFDDYTAAANRIPVGKNTVLSITGAEDSRLAIVKVQDALGNITDKTVTLRVNTAIGQQAINIIQNKLLSFGVGGTVPGPMGAERLAVVHGGEEVVPWHDKAAMAKYMPAPSMVTGGGGGSSGGSWQQVTEVINIVVDNAVLARAVRRRDRYNPAA